MNSKKVLYCITKSDWGGAQKYVVDIARHTAERDDMEVIVVVGRHEREGEDIFRTLLKSSSIRIIDLPDSGRDISLIRDVRVVFKLVRIFVSEAPDVVHLNSSKMAGLGAVAIHAASLPGIRVRRTHVIKSIYTIHGLPFLEDRSWLVNFVIRIATYITCLLVSRIITISNSEHVKIKRWPLIRKKVVTIYNGIEKIPQFSREHSRAVLSSKGDLDFSDVVVIGSVAELTRNKGHRYLLEALQTLKQKRVPFMFVNIGDGEMRRELQDRARETGLAEHVHFIEFVRDARQYLLAFDIFVLSSVKEGVPYSLLESGSAGIASVATDVGGIAEIINHDTGILVPARDSGALASALETLIRDTNMRTDLGNALQRHVLTEFTQKNMLKKTFSEYV